MGLKKFFGKLTGADKVVGKVLDTGADLTKTFSNKEQGSRRLKTDMESDSKLTKSIRPIIVIWSLAIFTIILVLEWLGIGTKAIYVSTVHLAVTLSLGFYMPARSVEKWFKATLKAKKKDPEEKQD